MSTQTVLVENMIEVKEIEPKYEAEAYAIWKYGMSWVHHILLDVLHLDG